MTKDAIDEHHCEALVARTCGGDENAWRGLVEHLWPHWIALVRGSRHMGSLARSEDHVHNVLANLVDKLGTDGGRAITNFPKWKSENAGKSFADWIRIVTSFTVKDYVRSVLGRSATGGNASAAGAPSGSDGPGLPSIKRLLNEFSTSPAGEEAFGSARPAMTAAQTARQLLDYAQAQLPADQMGALSLWLDGAAFEEIDAALGTTEPDAARKLVRAAIATLRRYFTGGDSN